MHITPSCESGRLAKSQHLAFLQADGRTEALEQPGQRHAAGILREERLRQPQQVGRYPERDSAAGSFQRQLAVQ